MIGSSLANVVLKRSVTTLLAGRWKIRSLPTRA